MSDLLACAGLGVIWCLAGCVCLAAGMSGAAVLCGVTGAALPAGALYIELVG